MKIFCIFIISLFPIWIFKSDLEYHTLLLSFLIFFIFPLIFISFLFFRFKNPKIMNLILVLTLFFGLDSNFKLWELVGFNYFEGLSKYYSAIFFSILVCTSLFLLNLKFDKKFTIFAFIFLFSGFVTNIFNNDSNIKNIKEYKIYNINQNFKNPLIIIILDELTSIENININSQEGKKAKEKILEFSRKYKFDIINKTYSIYSATDYAISSLLNFELVTNENYDKFIVPHNEYQFYRKLKSNRFFDLPTFKSISVFQNHALDFCFHEKVKSCNTFNHFSKNNSYLEGFKLDFFSVIISKYNYHNSIFSRFLSRVLSEFHFIHLHNLPRSNKAAFRNRLNNFQKEINLGRHDLYFAHFIVPHKPYAYNQKCNYEPINVSNKNIEETKVIHYQEIFCVFSFLDNFLSNIDDNSTVLIFSDHGSRIEDNDRSKYDTFFSIKNIENLNILSKTLNNNFPSQILFDKLFKINNFDENYNGLVFDYNTKKFRKKSF